MIQKERIVATRNSQDVEKLISKLTQGKPYTVVYNNELRSFDTKNGTLGELTDLVCTLINDLKIKGIIQK